MVNWLSKLCQLLVSGIHVYYYMGWRQQSNPPQFYFCLIRARREPSALCCNCSRRGGANFAVSMRNSGNAVTEHDLIWQL